MHVFDSSMVSEVFEYPAQVAGGLEHRYQKFLDGKYLFVDFECLSQKEQDSIVYVDLGSASEEVDLSAITCLENLRGLSLNCACIDDISPLAELPHLEELDVSSSLVSNIDVLARLPHLKRLSLAAINPEIDCTLFQRLGELKGLDLGYARMSNLDEIEQLTNLEFLSLRGNPEIRQLHPLRNLSKLRRLDIGENHLVDLQPLSRLFALRELGLEDCFGDKINGVWPCARFDFRPLAGLKDLEKLEFTMDSELGDEEWDRMVAPLRGLPNLQIFNQGHLVTI